MFLLLILEKAYFFPCQGVCMDKKKNLPLFSQCSAVVCDLDGTLYLDGVPFPDSAPFLNAVLASGRRLFYFPNNASRSRSSYLLRLERF